MAELHRVEINEKADSELEPEELAKREEELTKREEVVQDVPEGDNAPAVEAEEAPEGVQERPEWLPEKFKTEEEMAKAYTALEKKMGGSEETSTEEGEPSTATTVIGEASQEFFDKGELTNDTYESLAKIGLSKELVDSFAAGQAALQDTQSTAIKSAAEGHYDDMTAWAGEKLSDDEMKTFNEAVSTGTVDQAKFAVSGLYARYKTETGNVGPKLVTGETSGSDTLAFQSMQEVRRAMQDPRYKDGDKSYHAMIDRRLAVSNL